MPFDLPNLEQQAIGFVLIFFRVAGLMLTAPFFGSARVPRRFKVLIALVMTLPMVLGGSAMKSPPPDSVGMLTIGLASEVLFGITLGTIVSFVFVAAQWAGEMVGQQIGLNIAETLDPQYGGGGAVVGDLYFMIATSAFMFMGGHRQLVIGIHESLTALPPLSIFFSPSLFDLVLDYLKAATALTLRIASPMFVTMMVVDVSMGCISKTVPQLNVMSAGMAVRGMIGMLVLALGISALGAVLTGALEIHLDAITMLFRK